MNHFFLWIGPKQKTAAEGHQLLGRYKSTGTISTDDGEGWSISYAPQQDGLGAFRDNRRRTVNTNGRVRQLLWFGHAWSSSDGPQPAFSVVDQEVNKRPNVELIKNIRAHTDGVFALLLVDETDGEVLIAGDFAGSFHVYYRAFPGGVAISNSSALLGGLTPISSLDSLGVQELCSNAVANEDRSIWSEVRKLRGSRILKVDCRRTKAELISDSPMLTSLDNIRGYEVNPLPGLFDSISNVLLTIDRQGGRGPEFRELPWVADLTGGNDSRALMAAIVANHIHVASTVSGLPSDSDVQIGERLAKKLGIAHYTRPEPGPITAATFFDAVSLTDGEFDAVHYSGVAAVHRQHIRDGLQFSLNGSYGELGRGHAWRLGLPGMILPNLVASGLKRREPLTMNHPSVGLWKQYFSLKNPANLFSEQAISTSSDYFAGLFSRLMSYAGHLPQHAQLDLIHIDLRMERWQGRLLSSTNQLWPAISPWSFQKPLVQLLTSSPSIRRNGLLTRAFTLAYSPVLAREPLYTGNPAMPFSLRNAARFLPLIPFFADRARQKILSRFRHEAGEPVLTARKRQPLLCADKEIAKWLTEPLLATSELFNPDALVTFLSPDQPQTARSYQLWCRLLTLEGVVRLQARARGKDL